MRGRAGEDAWTKRSANRTLAAVTEDVDAFLSDFEQSRADFPDLAEGEPQFVRPLAAITLFARVQMRELRDEELELSEAIANAMPKEPPPEPEDWLNQSRAFLSEIKRWIPCTLCGVRPGFGFCPFCNGSGSVGLSKCAECNAGWVTCTTCDGTKRVCLANVRHVDDRDVAIRYTFVPATTTVLEEALTTAFDAEEPSECLRFDLDLRNVNAPYRTADEGVATQGSFHEHSFAESLDRTRNLVDRLGGKGTWLREEVRAYARPFLWVRSREGSDLALVTSPRAKQLLR